MEKQLHYTIRIFVELKMWFLTENGNGLFTKDFSPKKRARPLKVYIFYLKRWFFYAVSDNGKGKLVR